MKSLLKMERPCKNPHLKQTKEDDVLLPLRKWPSVLLYNYPHGILCLLSFTYQACWLLAALYLFLFSSALDNPLSYIMSTLGSLFAFFSYFILYTTKDEYHLLEHDIFPQLQSYSASSSYEMIKNDSKIYKRAVIFTLVMGLGTATVQLPWIGNEDSYNFPIMFWSRYGGPLERIGHFISFVQFYHFILVVDFVLAFMFYMVIHLKYQIQLLNAELKELAKILRDEIDLKSNVEENKFIEDKLLECVARHQILLSFSRRLNNMLYFSILLFVLSGVCIGVGIVEFMFTRPAFHSFIRALTYVITACTLTVSFILAGQGLETESENTFALLCDLPWYNYNITNRKILILFLMGTRQHIRLSCSGLIIVNVTLPLRILKAIYSVFTYLMNVKFTNS